MTSVNPRDGKTSSNSYGGGFLSLWNSYGLSFRTTKSLPSHLSSTLHLCSQDFLAHVRMNEIAFLVYVLHSFILYSVVFIFFNLW